MPLVKPQAGCLPVRDGPSGPEVLLVTSRYTGEWLAPKGGIEPGESAREAAARETGEEAGVVGDLVALLGTYDYPRGNGLGRLQIFVMAVKEQLSTWPERGERRRRWFSLDEALELRQRAEVGAMVRDLAAWLERRSGPTEQADGDVE